MANTLRFKRGLSVGLPTAAEGEPLFTTDTSDLYIGTSTGNQRFQKYIASGTTSQYLRGDGTLATFPSLTGFVPYTGATANVDLGTHTIIAQNATISSSGSGNTATITHSSGSGIGLNITKGGNGEGLYINKTSGSGNAATIIGTLNATTLVKSGGTSTQYLMADGSVSTLTNPITGTAASGQVAYFTGATTQAGSNNLFWDNTNGRLGVNTNVPSNSLHVVGTSLITGAATFNSSITATTDISARSGDISIGLDTQFSTPYMAIGWGGRSNAFNRIYAARDATAGLIISAATGQGINLRTNGHSATGIYMASDGGVAFKNSAGNNRAIIDVLGNIGISATSNYGTLWRALDIGSAGGSIALRPANAEINFVQNAYHNNSNWIYKSNGTSGVFSIDIGNFRWFTAPSGTAGNTVTFTEQMRLYNATGNLCLGAPTSDTGERLQVTGTAKITGAATFGSTIVGSSLISAATEFRLNNQSFTRVAIADSGGGFVGGYNLALSSGINPIHDSTGAISGIHYRSGGTILFYTGSSQTAGTAGTIRATIDATGSFGLGVTPQSKFHIKQSGNGFANGLKIEKSATDTQTYSLVIGGDNKLYLGYATTSGGAATTALSITSDNKLLVNSGVDAGNYNLQVTGNSYVSGNTLLNGTTTMNGNLVIGGSILTDVNFYMAKALSGSVFPSGIYINSTIAQTSTTGAVYFTSVAITENATFTLPHLYHFRSTQSTFGASSTVTNQYGFFAASSVVGATNNFGFYGDIASGTNRWNLYMNGSANNYTAGNFAIGSTANTTDWLNIAASTTAKAQIYLAAGTAPTAPANGDIWFDGTDLKMRIGGVTKTFTLV